MNRKTAMMEKTIRVKSMEWIMNLLVLMFSRLIPRNPLTKHPTKQIENVRNSFQKRCGLPKSEM
jgi:hypothetical protein